MSLKPKNYIYVCNPKPGECGRMTLAHARRLVRQGRADWHGPKVKMLTAQERVERAAIIPTVGTLRAKGVPAINVLTTVRRGGVKWPARLSVIERLRKAAGSLPGDPTELRSFATYPDKWSVADMRRDAKRRRVA